MLTQKEYKFFIITSMIKEIIGKSWQGLAVEWLVLLLRREYLLEEMDKFT